MKTHLLPHTDRYITFIHAFLSPLSNTYVGNYNPLIVILYL